MCTSLLLACAIALVTPSRCLFVSGISSFGEGARRHQGQHECDSRWISYTEKDEPELFRLAPKISKCVVAFEEVERIVNINRSNAIGHSAPMGQTSSHKPDAEVPLRRSVHEFLSRFAGVAGKDILLIGDSTMRYANRMLVCTLLVASSPENEEPPSTEILQQLQCSPVVERVFCTRIRLTGIRISYAWLQDLPMKSKTMGALESIKRTRKHMTDDIITKLRARGLSAGSILMLNHGVGSDALFDAQATSYDQESAIAKFRGIVEEIAGGIVTFAQQGGHYIMWRETIPQHFPTVNGGYTQNWAPGQDRSCAPFTESRYHAGVNIRNSISNSVMRRLRVPIVPVFQLFCSAWLEHLGGKEGNDCTHLSLDGNIVLVDRMLRSILSATHIA